VDTEHGFSRNIKVIFDKFPSFFWARTILRCGWQRSPNAEPEDACRQNSCDFTQSLVSSYGFASVVVSNHEWSPYHLA
jgi:hypothetical protein